MSELSKALGNVGSCHEVKSNGKVYKLRLVDQFIKVEYERKLYQAAIEAVAGWRAFTDEADYAEKVRECRDGYEAGDFAIFGERGQKALRTKRGQMLLLSLICDCDELEALQAIGDNPEGFSRAFEDVMRESFPDVKVKEKKKQRQSEEGVCNTGREHKRPYCHSHRSLPPDAVRNRQADGLPDSEPLLPQA